MKFILIIIRRSLFRIGSSIQKWIRENVIADGWQDSRGFHYSLADDANSLSDNAKCEKKNGNSEK